MNFVDIIAVSQNETFQMEADSALEVECHNHSEIVTLSKSGYTTMFFCHFSEGRLMTFCLFLQPTKSFQKCSIHKQTIAPLDSNLFSFISQPPPSPPPLPLSLFMAKGGKKETIYKVVSLFPLTARFPQSDREKHLGNEIFPGQIKVREFCDCSGNFDNVF